MPFVDTQFNSMQCDIATIQKKKNRKLKAIHTAMDCPRAAGLLITRNSITSTVSMPMS